MADIFWPPPNLIDAIYHWSGVKPSKEGEEEGLAESQKMHLKYSNFKTQKKRRK